MEAQEAKRFDLLHEWRAMAMSDTYVALCALQDAHEEFSRAFAGFVGGPTPVIYWEKLAKAGALLEKHFGANESFSIETWQTI